MDKPRSLPLGNSSPGDPEGKKSKAMIQIMREDTTRHMEGGRSSGRMAGGPGLPIEL